MILLMTKLKFLIFFGFFWCLLQYLWPLFFNSAYIEGGAIKWNNEEPLFFNNSYFNNSAIYGSDVATFPVRINKIYNNSKNVTNPDKNEILWPIQNHSLMVITNVSIGNPIHYILQFIIILDTYGKIVKLDIG